MKIKYLLLVLLISLIVSCSKESENDSLKNIPKNQVELKIKPNINNYISFKADAEYIKVDWGDGNIESYTSEDGNKFIHQYEDQKATTIKLETRNLSSFYKDGYDGYGEVLELYFGECPKLESIKCDTSLQVLDVHKVNNLKSVNIAYNSSFTETKLNELFSSLPYWQEESESRPTIKVSKEQKYTASIAIDRGWKVEIYVRSNSEINQDDEFNKEGGYKNALSSAYFLASNYLKNFYLFEALYSHAIKEEELSNVYQLKEIYLHDINSNTCKEYIKKLWEANYNAINVCNNIIAHCNSSQYDYAYKYGYSATIMKAFLYFNLINIWGDVPYTDKIHIESLPITPVKTILSYLITDLKRIEPLVPEKQASDFNLLFTKYTVKALLAKIYLYQEDYSNALKYAKEIINSKKFLLYENSSDIYIEENIYNNKESLNLLGALFNANNDGDIYIKKGYFTPSIRFAEILLIAAEATSKLEDKILLINELRKRNHRRILEGNTSMKDCNQAIIEEYKLDLGKEGLYFFALKRFNIASQTLNTNQLLLPIPEQHEF